MSDNIIVIGAGVSGVTTALTLQLLGYETEIIADKTVSDVTQNNNHPEFASLFPSASVIPHSVYSHRLEELFKQSQSFFYDLRKYIFPGITTHKHFEVFEFKADPSFIEKLEVNYRRDERVIRFLTFKLDKYAIEYSEKRRAKKQQQKQEGKKES